MSQKLLKNGSEVNAGNVPGLTALFIAASNGHDKCVEYLINNGVKVNMSDQQGRTSLGLAVVNGHLACVNLLIEAGQRSDCEQPRLSAANSSDESCVWSTHLLCQIIACRRS